MTLKKLMLVALLAGTAAFPAVALNSASATQAGPPWYQEKSDLKPDPAARFGKLPNGMRYVIYRNATPPGEASLRLAFHTGDLMETDEQNGLAHFIEHMAFNGTNNVKEGEMLKMLAREGMALGREINASTGPDRTVYRFDVPAATDAKLEKVLFLFREIASEIKFDPGAVDRERGIILSEDRSMYPPARKAFNEKDAFLYKGQLIGRRLNIGDLT